MLLSLLAMASLATSPVSQQRDPAAYPELAAEVLLPAIVNDLRRTVPDPHSIKDFLLCPASKLKFKDGRLSGWTVNLAFNAKNDKGGYTGLTPYVVGFKDGVIKLHALSARLPGNDGFDGLINRATLDRHLRCDSIPDTQIQELLARPITNGGR